MNLGEKQLRNRPRPKCHGVRAACRRLLEKAIVYARRKSWLKLVGRALLHAPMMESWLRRVQEWLLPRGRRFWVRVDGGLASGLWLQVDPYREQAYLEGNADPEVQDALATYLKQGGCFFDVGAHIGVYSLMACRLVAAWGRAVAFEPDPRNAQLIREHALRNGFGNISVAQVAVWRFDGEVCFRRGGLQLTGQSSRRGGRSAQRDNRIADRSKAHTDLRRAHAEAAAFIEDFLGARNYRADWMPLRYQFPIPRYLVATPHHR